MYSQNNKKITIIAIVVSFIIVFNNLKKNVLPVGKNDFKMLITNFYSMEFKGMVKERYIDRNNRNHRVLVLQTGKKSINISLDFESDNLFYSINELDTVIKTSKTFNLIIIRDGKKILKKINFDNYLNREKYPKNLETIMDVPRSR